jgi:hypothetical protein
MKNQIKWKAIEVLVAKIKPTPNNFKLKTEDGSARFKTSVDQYGLAGSVILNADYTLIDGNTRVEKAKELGHKKIWASMPDRKLTPKEFTEFAAMYDMARAGEVDINRIKEELGTTSAFFKKWGMDIPMSAEKALEKLEAAEGSIKPNENGKKVEAKEISLRPISLLFTAEQSEEFIRIAESLYVRFKTDNVTDLALKVIKFVQKTK